MSDGLKEMIDAMNRCFEIARSRPVGIKVNEKWLEKQIESNAILMEESKQNSFVGLPVRIDNTIQTYEFIWSYHKF
ncbi:hypothetical protein [Priestia megaterium]|uniref:hypothetical protein n=1 Tax=Priestia megaterium TaxID=1404 RepID=UPI00211C0874|nr:hypothetical protein [Priestia megaterium]